MKKRIFFITIMSVFLLVSMASLAAAKGWGYNKGAVYAMTNESDNQNKVVVFSRNTWGMLTKKNSYSTGGSGSGGVDGNIDPLASQGSLILSKYNKWLVAVNAGSDEISVFRVLPHGLALTSTVSSGGDFPTSVTLYHNILYVLNAGVDPNITGFKLTVGGNLDPIPSSTRLLPATPDTENPGGILEAYSQVGFDPHGDFLVVTDRGGSNILVFTVDGDNLPSAGPEISASKGPVPFGFIFDNKSNDLLVVEASGAVSAYEIDTDGKLLDLDSIPNGQTAACWIVGNGRGSVYTANTGSDTISLYKYNSMKAMLALPDAATATTTGERPIDMATVVTFKDGFLYTLNASDKSIGMYRIKADGSLMDLGSIGGLPYSYSQGIAAW